ncbi:MAG TPA: glycosyltransferase family protein [Bacteroidia bacterium]|nr:glycosyltransferase family protein [Bacteroidia bacterium]
MRILVSPLDWGLGHATRCIPIVRYLREKNVEVVLASDGAQLKLLQEQFPGIEHVILKGYNVRYSYFLPASMKVLLQVPKLMGAIKREQKELQKIIKEKRIDAVISDNRYGLYTDTIPCVLITHQLNIQASAGSRRFSEKVSDFVKKFNECWIPDNGGEDNLSGNLSHPLPADITAKYIGPLSRFKAAALSKEMKYDLLVLLSGPEPQRTILEKKVLKQLGALPYIKGLIVQGLPGNKGVDSPYPNVDVVPHLNDTSLLEKILSSKAIISRPGYSTIMDLAMIGGKRALFIPTPGQTEQEYLAMRFEALEIAVWEQQKKLVLKDSLTKVFLSKGFNNNLYPEAFQNTVDEWLARVQK